MADTPGIGELEESAPAPADGRPRMIEVDPDLLADVSHQLRNQLNAVVGAAGLLSVGAESSEERELAAIVETGAEQVARIIDEVLDAASLLNGQFELALHPFDVRSVVENCLSIISKATGLISDYPTSISAPKCPILFLGRAP